MTLINGVKAGLEAVAKPKAVARTVDAFGSDAHVFHERQAAKILKDTPKDGTGTKILKDGAKDGTGTKAAADEPAAVFARIEDSPLYQRFQAKAAAYEQAARDARR